MRIMKNNSAISTNLATTMVETKRQNQERGMRCVHDREWERIQGGLNNDCRYEMVRALV